MFGIWFELVVFLVTLLLSFAPELLLIDKFFCSNGSFTLVLLTLLMNLDIHDVIRRNFHRLYFSNRISNLSASNSLIFAAKTVFIFFASLSVFSFALIIGCKDHWSLFWSQVGPFHHKLGIWFPYVSMLPMSTGFSFVGSCLQVMYSVSLILLTLLFTNWL